MGVTDVRTCLVCAWCCVYECTRLLLSYGMRVHKTHVSLCILLLITSDTSQVFIRSLEALQQKLLCTCGCSSQRVDEIVLLVCVWRLHVCTIHPPPHARATKDKVAGAVCVTLAENGDTAS